MRTRRDWPAGPASAPESRPIVTASGHLRSGRSIALFALFTAIALLQRLDSLTASPIWDGAMTIWPGAVELSASGFDISHVLSLGSYADGGPATHSTSLMALAVAGLFSVISPAAVVFVTHLAMTAALGFLAWSTWAIVESATSSGEIALASAGAVVTAPLLVAQSTALYAELPATAAMYAALLLWHRNARSAASAVLFLAVWIKPTALLLILVLLLASRGRRDRLRAVASGLGVIPSLFAQGGGAVEGALSERVIDLVSLSIAYLRFIPEVVIFVIGAHVAIALAAVVRRDLVSRRHLWLALMGPAFVAFFLATMVIGPGQFALPRYIAFLLPGAVIMFAISLSSFGARIALVGLCGIIAFNVLGRTGSQYTPMPHPIYPVAERSAELGTARQIHQKTVDRLVDLSRSMSIVATHHFGYTLTYPELGYVDAEVPVVAQLAPAGQWSRESTRLDDLPSCFAAGSDFRGFEGELNHLLDEAESAGYLIEVERLTVGSMETTVWIVDSTPDDGC